MRVWEAGLGADGAPGGWPARHLLLDQARAGGGAQRSLLLLSSPVSCFSGMAWDWHDAMAWTRACKQALASKLMGVGYARWLADRLSWREVSVRKSAERCHALHAATIASLQGVTLKV